MLLQDGHATFVFPACTEALPCLSEWLEQILEEISFPVMSGQKIMICADEIATNIAAYAYPDGRGEISAAVDFNADKKEVSLTFTDRGVAFDPLHQQAPDTSAPLSDRKIGGLGILVVQRMMDHVEYRRDGASNVLTLVKRGDQE